MQKPVKQTSIFKRIFKILFWILVLILVSLVVAVIGFNIYLKSNEKKIIENASFLNHGSLSFDQAYITIFEDFPNASLVLKNTIVTDSQFTQHQIPLLQVDELVANLSFKKWKDQSFRIKKLALKKGVFNLHENLEGYNTLKSILVNKNEKNLPTKNSRLPEINIESDQIELGLTEFLINIVEEKKSRSIQLLANEISADLILEEDIINCSANLDLKILDLTFKKENGSFLKDAHISGNLNAKLEGQKVNIDPFPIQVNDQRFLFHGQIGMVKDIPTLLNLQSQKTRLPEVLPLLTSKIRKVIQPFEVEGNFYSNTQIYLQPPNLPKIDVQFRIPNNDLVIQKIPFQKASLGGRFINRSHFNGSEKSAKKGDIRLELSNLKTSHGLFKLESEDILITASQKSKPIIQSSVLVKGPAEAISDWYKNDKFFFEAGAFELKGDIQGPINNINDLVIGSTANLSLKDLEILYQPADVAIPIESLELYKKSGDAEFTILSTTLSKEYDYRMDGGLKNLTSLLVDFAKESASSSVDFHAQKLGWKDFVSLFSIGSRKKTIANKNEKTTKESMKKTIRGVYNKVHPQLSISLDTFAYFEKIEFYNVKTGVHFESENEMVLDQTSFDLDQGSMTFNAKLDISKPHQTAFNIDLKAKNINLEKILPTFDYFNVKILADQASLPDDFNLEIHLTGIIDDVEGLLANNTKGKIEFQSEHHDNIIGKITFQPSDNLAANQMDTKIDLTGNPKLFNDFFKNDKFFFQDTGRFHVDLDYTGSLASLDQLLDRSVADFSLTDAAVYYKDVDIIFPLDQLDVVLNQDTLDYKLHMYSEYFDRELDITGEIENVSELLFGNTDKKLTTSVNAYSPVINLEHAVEIFETPPDQSAPLLNQQIDEKIKTLISSLFNRFNPNLNVRLDTLNLSDKIQLTNFNTGSNFRDSTHLVLKQTDFQFANGSISLNAELDIGNPLEEAFTTNVSTENLDLAKLLFNFDYFGISSLKNAKQIDGQVDFNLDFSGSLRDLQLLTKKNQATLDFSLEDLQLKDIDIINEIARKLLVKRLFKEIQFAPISNKVTVTGNRLNIPQMEINSTGINLFIEGFVDNNKTTNLWISLPVDNIRKLRKREIPFKRGYAATKNKIHLEIFNNEKGKTKKKIRFSKRKFYKKEGIPEQFKIDKQKLKAIRRAKKFDENIELN